MIPTVTCQYCDWKGPVDECGPLHNAWERVQPGDPMPAGECPKCNASAMLDEDKPEPHIKIVHHDEAAERHEVWASHDSARACQHHVADRQ